MNSLPASASRYIVGVYAAAVAAVVWFLMPHVPLAHVDPEVLLLLAVFTLLGELRPINAPLGREGLELTTSNTFAFAILLAAGPALAALTLAASAMVSDVVGRKSWWKVLFNAAQYVLCIVAAGVTVDLLKGPVDESATTMLSSNRALFATSYAFIFVYLSQPRAKATISLATGFTKAECA